MSKVNVKAAAFQTLQHVTTGAKVIALKIQTTKELDALFGENALDTVFGMAECGTIKLAKYAKDKWGMKLKDGEKFAARESQHRIEFINDILTGQTVTGSTEINSTASLYSEKAIEVLQEILVAEMEGVDCSGKTVSEVIEGLITGKSAEDGYAAIAPVLEQAIVAFGSEGDDAELAKIELYSIVGAEYVGTNDDDVVFHADTENDKVDAEVDAEAEADEAEADEAEADEAESTEEPATESTEEAEGTEESATEIASTFQKLAIKAHALEYFAKDVAKASLDLLNQERAEKGLPPVTEKTLGLAEKAEVAAPTEAQ